MTDREAWFWINNIEGIGNIKIRQLLEYFGTPMEMYNASEKDFSEIPGVNDVDVARICDLINKENIHRKYNKFMEKEIKYVFPFEEEYPKRLKELYDKPFILYCKGRIPEDNIPSVAIIGSRKCTEYGRYVSSEFGRILGGYGVSVISGLALGIDSEAHRGCVLAGGRTYAVLAGSAEQCYPQSNYNLYNDILRDGGVISEFPPGTPTLPGLFPIRNRIVSGLADIVIVVEAGAKSGSLITVSHALEQNKTVYAVPGRIGDKFSEGCNRLIGEGAGVITSFDTILEELGIVVSNVKNCEKSNIGLAREEKMLYSLLLDFVPKSLDTLTELTGMSSRGVLKGLMGLELKGYIREISQNFYVRIR